MHFGENQLSPYSISFSLLSTPHPGLFQQAVVRSSNRCYPVFNLDMDRSYGFGSIVRDLRLFRLAFAAASNLVVFNFATYYNSTAHFQEARCHSIRSSICLLARGFRSVSLPARGAFHLSLSVLFLYRSLNVFSLGPWSARIRTELHVLRITWVASQRFFIFTYKAFTFFGQIFQLCSVNEKLCNSV